MNVIVMTTPKQTHLTQTQIVKMAIEAAETAVSAHGENFPDAESALDFLTFQVYADSEKTEDQMFAEKLDALLRIHSKSPEFVLFADTYRQACEDALSSKGVTASRTASTEPYSA